MGHSVLLFLALLIYTGLAAAFPPPCSKSDTSSLCLSKLRHFDRHTPQRKLESGNIAASSVRKSGRASRSGAAAASITSEKSSRSDCFPGDAHANVLGKGPVAMKELQIGDKVETVHGFSQIFMFSHRVSAGQFSFIKLSTNSSEAVISAGHYVFSSGRLVTAESLKVGHVVQTARREEEIVRVERVTAIGLYNPHTLTGELFVGGMRVSVYTRSVAPKLANSLLAPVRAVFQMFGVDITGNILASDVPDAVIQVLPKGNCKIE